MHKNKKQKVNFKLTTEKYKEIKNLVPTLPKIARTNDKGEIIYRNITSKTILGKDLNAKQRIEVGGKINADDRFVMKETAPILVNHEIELIKMYELSGDAGISSYVEHVKSLVDKSAEAKKKLEEKEESLKQHDALVSNSEAVSETSNEEQEG